MGEHYHSIHGAVQESMHIFLNHGYDRCKADSLSLLEVGFGTGLNAFLTAMRAQSDHTHIYYEAWEAFPIAPAEAILLNYPEMTGGNRDLFHRIHTLTWNESMRLDDNIILRKVTGDIRSFTTACLFDLVYFDAFGPDFQPELWETGIFSSIAQSMVASGILVTYSAKGQVRRNLKEAGFRIEKAPGPPGKREITIAIKL
jgi:tRNA U34 5-methylaminomethyl-2-thiouridine-forming methyltransferase MnmC